MNPLLLSLLALAADVPHPDGPLRIPTAPPPRPRGPRAVRCDRCGAPPGEPCDKRTLGAHDYHRVRVLAATG